MDERTVEIETPDGTMAAFLAAPSETKNAAGVVVAQEAFGVNDHIRDVCRRLAREGFAALAPELYHRSGSGIVVDYGDFPSARQHLSELTNDGIETDVRASLAFLRREPRVSRSRVSIIGFCVGGFVAFLAACRLDPDAAVCFYGGGIVRPRPGAKMTPLLSEASRIRARVLALFGEEDQSIPMDDVRQLREKLESLEKTFEIVTYKGAGHGFFCDRRDSYRPEAAQDAWERTLDWLRESRS